ncbi:MAG: hypothetical protein WDW38_001819 [Sanguina aurantia]
MSTLTGQPDAAPAPTTQQQVSRPTLPHTPTARTLHITPAPALKASAKDARTAGSSLASSSMTLPRTAGPSSSHRWSSPHLLDDGRVLGAQRQAGHGERGRRLGGRGAGGLGEDRPGEQGVITVPFRTAGAVVGGTRRCRR